MSKKNDDFFKEKKEWSLTKDAILGCYLKPYFQKLIAFGKPICYVDCFAGKGKFDDGKAGSPLIALDCINSSLENTRFDTNIYPYFIELNHSDALKINVSNFLKEKPNARLNPQIVPGKFEDKIDSILRQHSGSTVFLYVDPYGIKALNINKFNDFKLNDGKSVEMLINFNTWGFFREACRVLGADFKIDDETKNYLVEYDPNNDLNREELNVIAGGNYWEQIVLDYKNNLINPNEAELRLSNGISKAFNNKYQYVLNVPIKSKENNKVPKYRLYHLTNHTDGCLLMAENMFKRINEAKENMRRGQMSLFETDTEGDFIDPKEIKKNIYSCLRDCNEHLNQFLCRLYTEYGLIDTRSNLNDYITQLEKENKLVIEREPKKTKIGKKTTFMSEGKGKSVYIRSYKNENN